MKIKHTLKRDGKTISGRIKETIFEEGEERGEYRKCYSTDMQFHIVSYYGPMLDKLFLWVWGSNKNLDNNEISYTHSSEEEAIQVMRYIEEFTLKEEIEEVKPKEEIKYVYVSDWSIEDALENKCKKILLYDLGEEYKSRYVCCTEDKKVWVWGFIAEIPKEETLTIKEAQDKLKELTGKEYFIN